MNNMIIKLKKSLLFLIFYPLILVPIGISQAIDSKDEVFEGVIRSPLPGRINKIEVLEGQHVLVGDILCVIEVMKMEIMMVSPFEARIEYIFFKEGENIDFQSPLISFMAYEAESKLHPQIFQRVQNQQHKNFLVSFGLSNQRVQNQNAIASRSILNKCFTVEDKEEVSQKQILGGENSLFLISHAYCFESFLVKNLLLKFSETNRTETTFFKKIFHYPMMKRKRAHAHVQFVKSAPKRQFKGMGDVLIQKSQTPSKNSRSITIWEILGLTVIVGFSLLLNWSKAFLCYVSPIRKKKYSEIVKVKNFIYLEKPIANNMNQNFWPKRKAA